MPAPWIIYEQKKQQFEEWSVQKFISFFHYRAIEENYIPVSINIMMMIFAI